MTKAPNYKRSEKALIEYANEIGLTVTTKRVRTRPFQDPSWKASHYAYTITKDGEDVISGFFSESSAYSKKSSPKLYKVLKSCIFDAKCYEGSKTVKAFGKKFGFSESRATEAKAAYNECKRFSKGFSSLPRKERETIKKLCKSL